MAEFDVFFTLLFTQNTEVSWKLRRNNVNASAHDKFARVRPKLNLRAHGSMVPGTLDVSPKGDPSGLCNKPDH